MKVPESGEEIVSELDSLVLQMLVLTQDLVTAKLNLESAAKNGWFQLAQARHKSGLGHTGLGRLQLPSEDGEKEVTARVTLEREECLKEEGVRYNHFTEVKTPKKTEVNEMDSKLDSEGNVEEKSSVKKKVFDNADPIRWFGVLSPPSLKQSQADFQRCVSLSVEIANMQGELLGVEARVKYLQRLRRQSNKVQTETENNVIEDLDSSLANSSLRDH